MKKMLTLGLVLAMVMMFSVGVMATDPVDPDKDPQGDFQYNLGTFEGRAPLEDAGFFDSRAKTIGEGGDLDYKTIVNLDTSPPANYLPDSFEAGDQEGTVIIPAIVNIPCYLEMELFGNGGNTKIKSLGSGAFGTVDWNEQPGAGNHFMLFDARMGGFLDNDWNFVDASAASDPTFSTVPATYITACDLWTAELTSNLGYALGVSSDLVKNPGDSNSIIEMRYTDNDSPGWSSGEVLPVPDFNLDDPSTKEVTIGNFTALTEASVTMQFRVPFDGMAAGSYKGDVFFRAYTI